MINLDNYRSLRVFLFLNYPKFHSVVYFKQSWRYNKQWGHHALKNIEFKNHFTTILIIWYLVCDTSLETY